MSDCLVPGLASAAGTVGYARRFPDAAQGHFRPTRSGLQFSSIGLGAGGFTRKPAPESATVYGRYVDAVRSALQQGLNVIDTAINYGEELAERIVGHALKRAFFDDGLSRDEIIVATKGGYLPFSAECYKKRFGSADDLAAGIHSLAPAFLDHQIDQSRRNLGLEAIDIYFLHNPEEQFIHVGRPEASDRLRTAFETLEAAVDHGWIGCYGVASGEGFRVPGPEFHSLDEILSLAQDVAGEGHHLYAIEAPFNLAMQEVLTVGEHRIDGRRMCLLEAAGALRLCMMVSASIHRGRVPFEIPAALRSASPALATDAQHALQFARSAPNVTTALVGMSRSEHVEENAALRRLAPLDLLAPAVD